SLIFQQGVELVDFAAFTLLDGDEGRQALRNYYDPYFELAASIGTGIVIDTPTWRASLDWGARQGYDTEAMADINRRAVRFVADIAGRWTTVPTVVNGVIGPRGDGYVVGHQMSIAEATRYHAMQVEAFATAGAAMVTAVTMNYVEEAIGITRAARNAGIPVVISFTVETDGQLPTGQPLGEAIEQVDADTDMTPVYFMVNCAHPSHFDHVLGAGAGWVDRVEGIRANASALSHAELDEATDLDRGDLADLAARYVVLRELLGGLSVVGGCCGTDHEHVAAIARALR
ncbi:MAG TPA: homocysteine S-methyltransferase family protein, partial [Ilumatobacteraceae bacterium]|nr:homocysteine S-methyltransferase family protein [Ilumatobacteraceae bacterium]